MADVRLYEGVKSGGMVGEVPGPPANLDNQVLVGFIISDPGASPPGTRTALNYELPIDLFDSRFAQLPVTTADLESTTGADTNVVTGTAGADGYLAAWNADGDVIQAGNASMLNLTNSKTSTGVPNFQAGEVALTIGPLPVIGAEFTGNIIEVKNLAQSAQAYLDQNFVWHAQGFQVAGSSVAVLPIDLTTDVTGLLPDVNIASAATWNAKLDGTPGPDTRVASWDASGNLVSIDNPTVVELTASKGFVVLDNVGTGIPIRALTLASEWNANVIEIQTDLVPIPQTKFTLDNTWVLWTFGGYRCEESILFGITERVTDDAGPTLNIDLNARNHQTINLSTASAPVTVAITTPVRVGAGTLIMQQKTGVSVTWTPTPIWLGTEPDFGAGADDGKYRIVSWRWDGTNLFLSSTPTN